MRILAQTLFVMSLVMGIVDVVARGADEAKKPETKRVPLEAIYSSVPQKGLKHIQPEMVLLPSGKKGFKQDYGFPLNRLLTNCRAGMSDIFLAKGDDLTTAVAYTYATLAGGGMPRPKDKRDPRQEKYWLVALVGMGAMEPLTWEVLAVDIGESSMQLTYEKKARGDKSTIPFLYWIPLGELKAGTYALELFDAEQKTVSFARRVAVR